MPCPARPGHGHSGINVRPFFLSPGSEDRGTVRRAHAASTNFQERDMRRTLAAISLLLTVFAATAACTKDEEPAKPGTKVAVGVIPIIDVAPIYLGRQKGFFASRGIDLDLVPEQGGAPIVKGVLAGKYQFGFSNVTSLMAAQAGGAPLKAVASGVASTGRPGRDFSALVVNCGR